MKTKTNRNSVILSSLALTLALAIWTPVHAQSPEPAEGKGMAKVKMMERCQEMMAHKKTLAEDIKAQDARLTQQLAEMNRAPENRKMGLMAAILTRMVEQRITMDARKAAMEEEMMQHMMQHMQMGQESMAACPMMQGMKSKNDSGDAHKEHEAHK
ncbi:MAG: hypothetical protein ABI604_00175 [Nitrospirota bacterium]